MLGAALDSEEVICVAGKRLWFERSVAIGSLNPEAGWIVVLGVGRFAATSTGAARGKFW
jgi:hypothetical protein